MTEVVVRQVVDADVLSVGPFMAEIAEAEMTEFFGHFFSDSSERQAFHHEMVSGVMQQIACGHACAAYVDETMIGVAVWNHVARKEIRQRLLRDARTLLRRVRRQPAIVWSAYDLADRYRVIHPHYYLMFMGVTAAWRNAGIGAKLLRPLFRQASTQPIYLTTTTMRNQPFYRRQGFVVVGTARTRCRTAVMGNAEVACGALKEVT